MTTRLSKSFSLIGMQDLNAKGMLATQKVAQEVGDARFFEVKRQRLYQSEQDGGDLQLGARFVASAQTSHHCCWVKEDLALADRRGMCQQCAAKNEREKHAALTLGDEAIRLMTQVPAVACWAPELACGVGSSGVLECQHVKLPTWKQEQNAV